MSDANALDTEIESKLAKANWAQQVKAEVVKKMRDLVDREPDKCLKAIRALLFDSGPR